MYDVPESVVLIVASWYMSSLTHIAQPFRFYDQQFFFFFLMIRRPPRSTHCISSAASDVYKRQDMLKFSGWSCLAQMRAHVLCVDTVSYTHLTLPTICSVQISVVAVSLKKKKKTTNHKSEKAERYESMKTYTRRRQ
eukprot:TRINITY_DN4315_c0_g2_i1.p1 TRINITY_DN4315_c0_g2~~TRINITY_DN4315_c0_g2_i1.p1  ORF type:complete len:137 (+),score=31.94 TRINITY_DN4315_c0_g2_i1:1-411(+)